MIAIYDKRLPGKYLEAIRINLNKITFYPLFLCNNSDTYDSIRFHPDIYLLKIDTQTCIYAPCLSNRFLKMLQKSKTTFIQGLKNPTDKYPFTAGYNAVILGEHLLHNLRYTDRSILDTAYKKSIKPIHVPQGYTRCSTIPLRNNALITADLGIAKAVAKHNIDVLPISPGYVILPGEKYGFLGGATGILSDGTILFMGDISLHPDSHKIKSFLKKHKIQWINLEGLPLFDCGTIIFFP